MTTLDVAKSQKSDIHKKLFKIKAPNAEGLLLNIQQSSDKKSTRFTLCDVQSSGNILALANNDCQIYIIDFLESRFWKLKTLQSCTYIKLSECNESHILVGKANGVLEVLNIDNGGVLAKLLGHQHPIVSVSFTQSNTCVSSSKYEAIIWDLSNYNKLQVLTLEKKCALKFVLFVPVSNHILVCYKDDIIQIWQHGSYKNLKQFHPSNWRNSLIKSIAFSRNGKVMAISGYLPILALFQLDQWKVLKIVELPDYINTVKKVQFIPKNFDGGCNKLLAILSGSGVIYFYNVEDDVLISELKSQCEIGRFCIACMDVQYIACLLCSGQVEVYDVNFLTMKSETVVKKAQEIVRRPDKVKLRNFCRKYDIPAKIQMERVLEVDKLKTIIKEYEEFPEAFRATIWERVLKLPNNIRQYNNFVNHMTLVAFEHLQEQFPLEDKVTIRCLRHLLNNVVTWCPFFAEVEYLPFFLFPFVKIFHKKPIACFELCCTIIVNWCQHWFEYHPLPPVNVLAIIDNMLIEHDAAVLQHFSNCNIKPIVYSWSLLEAAFSEVLTAFEWLKFWDHVFINEPSFLLCAVAAFLIVQKKYFLLLTEEDEFHNFFHSQKPLDFRKFLSKTYHILNSTSAINHPRQYLNMFTCLTCGNYPIFEEYPKEIIKFQVEHVHHLEHQLKETINLKEGILKEESQRRHYDDIDIKNEEARRILEVEKACMEKIKSYQQNLITQQQELRNLRQELLDQENVIINNARKKLDQNRADKMELLASGLDMSEKINEVDIRNLEEAYKLEGLGLSKASESLEKALNDNEPLISPFADELSSAHRENVNLKTQIKEAKTELGSPRKANIALTITAMNNLINEIESKLAEDGFSTSVKEDLEVRELEKEVKKLRKEVSLLLKQLSGNRTHRHCWASDQSQCKCPNKTVKFSASNN